MKNFIKKEVNRLILKHDTNNPFEIAKGENIIILYENLGSIYGYYNKYARQKFIHLNENLDSDKLYLTCGHELGHSIIHPDSNTPFFRANSFYSINKLEKQANYFNAELRITDNLVDRHILSTYSVEQLAIYYNVPIELIKLKFNL